MMKSSAFLPLSHLGKRSEQVVHGRYAFAILKFLLAHFSVNKAGIHT
jgi:hypothetical protein